MSALHLNLHAHLGYWINVSTYAQASGIARNEQTSDIQGSYQCPSLVVFLLQFSFFIFQKQLRRKLVFWNVSQCNFCVLPEISGMARIELKRRTVHVQAWGYYQPGCRASRQGCSQDLFLGLLIRHA